jgi:hypothetical protein
MNEPTAEQRRAVMVHRLEAINAQLGDLNAQPLITLDVAQSMDDDHLSAAVELSAHHLLAVARTIEEQST